ncbi:MULTISPECIES: RNase H family protein [unclassified Clostridium]|uniref:RNase H family protein n=1 Tax=unclassified Clostridium TaxID=2614128 RepID=UPI0002974C37|nr:MULTISPECIES: RNase H family protein [unclassified Clostridium]EKQ57248.1 MAG: ribonuclease HI [Clostridium sp. Maddingley MBC34-26]
MSDTNISIYTDGSYRDNIGGYGFYIQSNTPVLSSKAVYGVCPASSSTAIEIIAITKAIQYLNTISLRNTNLAINCDVINIVQTLNNKFYEKWDKYYWKNGNNQPITSNIDEWFALITTIKNYGEDLIKFKKSKIGRPNTIAHCSARLGLDLSIDYDINTFHIVDKVTSIIKNNPKLSSRLPILNDTLTLQKPWESNSTYSEKISWFNPEYMPIEYIDINNIILTEETHLQCRSIPFNGSLQKVKESGEIINPLAIRPVDNEKYSLVAGMKSFCVSKLLFSTKLVPCYITELTHDDFIAKYGKIVD